MVELADGLRSGRFTARSVAEHHLARADAVDPWIRSLVWRDDEATLAAADAVDRRRAAGGRLAPFSGVPVTVKDTFAVAGQPRTQGSLAIGDDPAATSDLIVEAVLGAGCVQLGRSATPELAMTTSCESPRNGVTHNPWDLTRSPGGSSGGSAAAVAAGIVPAALASDGGGSLRVPAAFCGLVGLKPSRGVLPQRVTGWEGGATEGVITRTVADTAALFTRLCGADPFPWATAPSPGNCLEALVEPVPRLRVGVLTQSFDPRIAVDSACVAAVEDTAQTLRELGHAVTPLEPPSGADEIMDIYPRTIIPTWLALTPLDRPELVQPYIRRVIAQSVGLGAADYVREAVRLRILARETLAQLFARVDVVLTPTTATRVPRIGVVLDELRERAPSRDCEVYERTLAFTTVPSVLGTPAISLPAHLDDDGLPVGVQLVGRQLQERTLLQLGHQLEQRYRWHDRRPPEPSASSAPHDLPHRIESDA